jgi:hypothetical protein
MTECDELHELSADSTARRAHLDGCAACRLEEKWRADFAVPAPGTDDSELERRLVASVLARPSVVPVAKPPARRTRYVVLAVAATLLMGLAFAANLGREPAASPLENGEVETPAQPVRATPVPVLAPAPPPRASVVEAEKPKPEPIAPAPSAEDLFARANSARRAGNVEQALALYRELQKRSPKSREALASRAVVGRLLLDRGDARGALPEFDAYLASGGTLSEEALAGRALALERLGRSGEERVAWRTLLERHPSTLHRAHAEERLAE